MSLRSPEYPADDFRNFVHGIILGFNADVEGFAAFGIVEKAARLVQSHDVAYRIIRPRPDASRIRRWANASR